MLKNQFQICTDRLGQLGNLDVDTIFAQQYAGQQNISALPIQRLTIGEFVALFRRTMKQFESEFKEGLGTLLPIQYSFPNEYGGGTLDSDFQNLLNQLNSKQFAPAEGVLLRLVYYQIANGFFDKSSVKVHDTKVIEIEAATERIKLLTSQVEERTKQVEALSKGLTESQTKTNQFVEQKRNELAQISQNLQTTNETTRQINQLLNNSTESNTKLTNLLSQQEKNLKQSEDTLAEGRTTLDEFKKQYDSLLASSNEQLVTFKKQTEQNADHLKFVEGKRSFFEERVVYLENLIGREVGVSLFETFKQRKQELQGSVTFWKYAVPAMSVITVIWIIAVFYWFNGLQGGIQWPMLALNSLKILPVLFVLFFTFQQYSKERNYQEEYAFKSAVALTVKAYADILKNEENKDKLILQAVLGVYRPPEVKSEDKNPEVKTILDTAKNMSETVRDFVKGKA